MSIGLSATLYNDTLVHQILTVVYDGVENFGFVLIQI